MSLQIFLIMVIVAVLAIAGYVMVQFGILLGGLCLLILAGGAIIGIGLGART